MRGLVIGSAASYSTNIVAPLRSYHLHNYTFEEYLDHESASNVKHEFLEGEIYAMAGGTIQHAIVSMNVGAGLGAALRGSPCVVASSDLKVRVLATGLVSYPDVTVICGPAEPDPKSPDVLLNPTAVVEVLSKGTETFDRGEKLDHYKKIPSVRVCVLVGYRERRVEVVTRQDDGSWITQVAGPGESIGLGPLGCTLSVDDVYRNVVVP